ncbi:hypothetical protein J1N35_014043 [Gossypium stocksii]|uniref:Uncharacterized protein n=1 Tax=Gossypium stocksii TaxID=47602 RepID=A0A9D3VTQ3_9ROSI|nr:hypothetical protein J1N35_014043 [Gossypium stocksii]
MLEFCTRTECRTGPERDNRFGGEETKRIKCEGLLKFLVASESRTSLECGIIGGDGRRNLNRGGLAVKRGEQMKIFGAVQILSHAGILSASECGKQVATEGEEKPGELGSEEDERRKKRLLFTKMKGLG